MIANQNTQNLETGFEYAEATSVRDERVDGGAEHYEKWPLGVRAIIVIGLSSLLWIGIFSAVSALFF